MEGILKGYTPFLSKVVYEMVSTCTPGLWTQWNNCNIYLISSVAWPELNKLERMVFLADKQWNPLFVIILCRTKPSTMYGTFKKEKWLTSSLFQRIIDFYLVLINLMRDKRQLLLPSKSCGYGIVRIKVIVCYFHLFFSYLTFPHFVSM